MLNGKYIALCTLLLLIFHSVSFSQSYKGACLMYEYEGNGKFRIIVDSYWENSASGLFGIGNITANGNATILSALDPKVPLGSTEVAPDGLTRYVRQEALISWPATGFYIVEFAGTGRVAGGSNFSPTDGYGLSMGVNFDSTTVCSGTVPSIAGSSSRFYDTPIFRFKAGASITFDFNTSGLPGYSYVNVLATPVTMNSSVYATMLSTGFQVNPQGEFHWSQPQPGVWLVNSKVLEFCNGNPTGNCLVRDFLIYVDPANAPNGAPECAPDVTRNIVAGSSTSFLFQANDPDGNRMSLFANGEPIDSLGAYFDQISFGPTSTGLFSWIPPAGSEGTYRIQFLAVDNAASPLMDWQNLELNVMPPPPTLETQCLVTEYLPGGFSFFLTGITGVPNPEYVFEGLGGVLRAFDDSTATLTGMLVNKDSAHCRWEVDLKFSNRKDWTTWNNLGRSYKGGFPAALANHPTWDFYELDSTSVLCGMGAMMGDTLHLKHMPVDFNYGFQLGVGANDKTGELGFSGWFTYSGSFIGAGDCNVAGDCRGRVPAMAIRANLEGAMPGWSEFMVPSLNPSNLIPMSQPYNTFPYFYNGNENVRGIPSPDIVDWILVQFHDPFDPLQVVHRQAAFLRKDMNVVDLDGSLAIELPTSLVGAYYISICHRNHIDIMSKYPIIPEIGGFYSFDFTKGPDVIYTSPELSSIPLIKAGKKDRWAMVAGDTDGNQVVNPLDIQVIGKNQNTKGYHPEDVDHNGIVNPKDADKTYKNYFIQSHIPR